MPFQLSLADSRYPSLLKNIDDPPPTLWGDGDEACLSNGIHLAIVGARECTPYGEKIAFELARQAAQAGLVVVSGLAYGIDAAAHRGALAGGGKTIAVLGCGLDLPPVSQTLQVRREIETSGAVITEFAPGIRATRWTFPKRNRIISGLSVGCMVIEAGQKSGSLITADFALQQGREVFAVPGNITSPLSAGTNRLIQQGAKLVASFSDVLEELNLGSVVSPPASLDSQSSSPEERRILDLLCGGPRHIDELLEVAGCSIDVMSSLLVELEINGKIHSLSGSRFALS